MDYYKYNKYKTKYLNLLNLHGGAAYPATSQPTDVMVGNEVKCVCGEVFANEMVPRSATFTNDCDFKVQPCFKCGKHICIYCGDEVAPIFGRSNGKYSAHNTEGKEPVAGSYDSHFGWASPINRPYNGGEWPRNSGWCLKRPDVTKYKTESGEARPGEARAAEARPGEARAAARQAEEIRRAIEQVRIAQDAQAIERVRRFEENERRRREQEEGAQSNKICPICTYINPPHKLNCEMCGTKL